MRYRIQFDLFTGNNPTSVCELCVGSGEQKCTSSDPHAGFGGAFKCLQSKGDFAFLRHDTVMMSTPDTQVMFDLMTWCLGWHGLQIW
jgi:hypothetical protein